MRDDQLADVIKQALQGKQVHDVKILVQSCYGGGLLDDIGAALNGLGVPWVAGSASEANQVSWGPSNAAVGATNRGDFWTDALLPGIGKGGNIGQAIDNADANNARGDLEDGVRASGNGGNTITWDGAVSHYAVLFAGNPDRKRHHNDISNMASALADAWSGHPHDINPIAGGSKQDLIDAINKAASFLDAGEQLVLYITDHGDTEFDIDEWWEYWVGAWDGIVYDGFTVQPPLHDGWATGLSLQAQTYSAGESSTEPAPYLKLTGGGTSAQALAPSWDIYYADTELILPASLEPGEDVLIPVPWDVIGVGNDTILFDAVDPDDQLVVAGVELGSGPITTIPPPDVGGMVELPVGGSDAPASAAGGSGSSAPPYAVIAGASLAAALVALTAGGWYARRRLLR